MTGQPISAPLTPRRARTSRPHWLHRGASRIGQHPWIVGCVALTSAAVTFVVTTRIRPEFGTIVEAADIPVHVPVRVCGARWALVVDGDRGRGGVRRDCARVGGGLHPHRALHRKALCPASSSDLRGVWSAGARGLLALHPDRCLRPDGRGAVPRGDLLSSDGTVEAGLAGARAGLA